jgi:hypothetical protein
MGVIRYTFNNIKDSVDVGNYLDLGVKAQYTHNKWNASVEGVYRHATAVPEGTDKNYTYRWAATFNYKFSDKITLSLAYGANFNGNTTTYTSPSKIAALAGLNFGMFK